MNLKESYRYANFLDTLLSTAYTYLKNRGFMTTTHEEHLRSKANPEAKDETLVVDKPFDVEFTPNKIIDFAVKVIEEKECLMNSIAVAKAGAEINIDNAISMNKKKQGFVSVLNNLAAIKPSEKKGSASDYKFNAEGNQVMYRYETIVKTEIDFDRNDVRKLAKKYMSETDAISAKLDSIEINTEVPFKCKWDINNTFEELVLAE